ncbi:MAG: hypothetical protein HY914_01200 [Desulfomonile tiedjei]|jgi:hypothetical protein|nr:hypothetical protein [Desulfomonile tiedjei]
MFTEWEKEFDMVCGAAITGRHSEPLEDSGVCDLLHGIQEDERRRRPRDEGVEDRKEVVCYCL